MSTSSHRGTRRRHPALSGTALVLGAIVFLLGGLAGFLNANVVNGQRFAEHVNQMRYDTALQQAIGNDLAEQVVAAQPDLIAIRPAIATVGAAVIGSTVLDGVFTQAVASFHAALTSTQDDSVVLTLADLGATVTTALDTFAPKVAEKLPPDLNVRLAQIGGQKGVAATLIPIVRWVAVLAWSLPVLGVLLFAAAVLLAPQRRVMLVRVGWAICAGGAVMGLVAAVGFGLSLLQDTSTLTGAVTAAGLQVFTKPLVLRALATIGVGAAVIICASAMLPQVQVHAAIATASRKLTAAPASPVLAVIRALLIAAVGVGLVAFPSIGLAVVTVAAGVVVFLYGISELDKVAEAALAADRREQPAPGRRTPGWLVPAVVAAVGVLVLAAFLIPAAVPQQQAAPVVAAAVETDPTACNGHPELCGRRFDEVAYPASHNSMSDGSDPDWYLAEQPKDMIASLDDGIRVLLVDTWYGQATESGKAITADKSFQSAQEQVRQQYGDEVLASVRRTIDRIRQEPGVGPVEPYFCHTLCELGGTPVVPELRRLGEWMDAHPRDVVTLFIQDEVSPADTAAAIEQAGLEPLLYTPRPGQPWPTLQEMIDSGQRLVVLMENRDGGTEWPWLQPGFDVVQDTGYTYKTAADFDCKPNRGTPESPILLVNHWLAGFDRLVSNAEEVNALDVLGPRVEACRSERGMLPNFVAVNWYDRGDLFGVVDALNGVGATDGGPSPGASG